MAFTNSSEVGDFQLLHQIEICVQIPPKVNSHGLLVVDEDDGATFLNHALPLLELQMAVIFLTSQTIHFFLKRFGVSFFVSCALTGIILGPSALGRYDFMRDLIFPYDSQDLISDASILGYVIFLILTAVKMDLRMALVMGRKAMSIGIMSVVAPLILSILYEHSHRNIFRNEIEVKGSNYVVACQSLTTFTVTAYIMNELKITNSELGRLGLSSALIADILGIFLIFVSNLVKEVSLSDAVRDFTGIFYYILFAILVLRPFMLWMIRQTPEGSSVSSSYLYIIMALAFGTQVYFHIFHQIQYQGPLIFGFTVPSGPPLGSALVEKFEALSALFLPILVAISMMRVDISLICITQSVQQQYHLGLIGLSLSVKFLSCLITALYYKVPLSDSVALALILSSKGIVELYHFSIARDSKTITDDVFTLFGVSILINSTIFLILVKCLYDPSRKYAGYDETSNNIESLEPDTEFRIVACIHRPDNVPSVIRLLDISYPTRESPITVYVLHLIKLIGRSTPTFISHQKQKPISLSCSQNVIFSFNQYEQNNWDVVSVQTYTAISPSNQMNEDIYMLALDKLASLILMPLHRKWSNNGYIESEDNVLRNVNCKILDKAPCSVGIFFDRSKRIKPSEVMLSLSICMIFLGGNDDREALALAKRMAKNGNHARLTVIHLIPEEDDDAMKYTMDRILDNKALEEIKKQENKYGKYIIQFAKDGPTTASIIRSIVDEYDFFIVGRRYGSESPQTLGLAEWSEFPELGIIGDLLASKDLNSKAFALVVQHQNQMNQVFDSL